MTGGMPGSPVEADDAHAALPMVMELASEPIKQLVGAGIVGLSRVAIPAGHGAEGGHEA